MNGAKTTKTPMLKPYGIPVSKYFSTRYQIPNFLEILLKPIANLRKVLAEFSKNAREKRNQR